MKAFEVMGTADDPDDESSESVKASLRRSLQEAKAGHRLPLSQMWEGIDAGNATAGSALSAAGTGQQAGC